MLALAVVLAPGLGAAATYYVDNARATSGNGKAWTSAWKSFASINWAAIQPGDTILVSGGRKGKTYRESLVVNASGTAAAPIVIAAATASAHSGPVTIEGQSSLQSGILIESDDYVTVRGFNLRNFTVAGIRIRFSRGVVAEGNSVHAIARGFYVYDCDDVVVRDNSVTTPTYLAAQTDGVYSMLNRGVRYEGNRIVISNGEPTGHDDGIQLYQDSDTTIVGNYVEQRNAKTGNAIGIFIVDSQGIIRVHNNVVHGPNTYNSMLALLNQAGTNAALWAFNNTLVGAKWGVVQIEAAPNSLIKNNIFYSATPGAAAMIISGARPPTTSIDHNQYHLAGGGLVAEVAGNGAYGWSQWQGQGFERNGQYGDPLFTSYAAKDFTLAPASPAIDAGAALAQVTEDHAGTPRPQGAVHDMGAYEQ